MLSRVIWIAAAGLALILASGCATVRTTIPPSDYRNLHWPKTYTITSRDGEIREASNITKQDSALVIVSPRYPPNDRRQYPVTIAYDDIESIETVEYRSVLHVEAGAEAGPSLGDDSGEYSPLVGVIELGYVTGELKREPGWDYGGTMLVTLGESEARVGVKARARHRFSENLSLDIGAGPMLDTADDGFFAGFVGGLGLNAWSTLSVRSEVVTYQAKPWRENTGPTYIDHPGGTEVVWYNGVSVLGKPAWITMGVAAAAMVVYGMALAQGLSGLN